MEIGRRERAHGSLGTVEEDAVLREDVSGTVTKVVISANRETEPDEIVVAWE